jgi:hypothetical protein
MHDWIIWDAEPIAGVRLFDSAVRNALTTDPLVFRGEPTDGGHWSAANGYGMSPTPGGGKGWYGITYEEGGVHAAAATDVTIVVRGVNVTVEPLPKPSIDPLTCCHAH